MSMAPPALETPSRFTAGTGTALSPRSRRARTLRALRRAAWYGAAIAALALAFASFGGADALSALAAQLRGVL